MNKLDQLEQELSDKRHYLSILKAGGGDLSMFGDREEVGAKFIKEVEDRMAEITAQLQELGGPSYRPGIAPCWRKQNELTT